MQIDLGFPAAGHAVQQHDRFGAGFDLMNNPLLIGIERQKGFGWGSLRDAGFYGSAVQSDTAQLFQGPRDRRRLFAPERQACRSLLLQPVQHFLLPRR